MIPQIRNVSSPNFGAECIPAEFLVLHYTACNLEETLRIFSSTEKQVCAHFVIDLDGTICDLGNFWDGTILRGAHAGKSAFALDGKTWESLNKFSIGVELVNFNGNFFPFPDAQYAALAKLVFHLRSRFPELRDPRRVVGHEQIAGFRGKSDPGLCFDWARFYADSYAGVAPPVREPLLNARALARFEELHGKIDRNSHQPGDWAEWRSKLEGFAVGVFEERAKSG